jgi:hypothetical protein
MWHLDHLAVVCADLDEGTAWAESALGVRFQRGGKHARYGTHNRLLGLGAELYLEVIAIDPEAAVSGPRWFGLDDFTGPPRLGNWIVACDRLDEALDQSPEGSGDSIELQRGDLKWRISVPVDGSLPVGGGWPTLIEWAQGTRHPASRLDDSGLRLERLTIGHPDAATLSSRLATKLIDPRIVFDAATAPSLSATFHAPQGVERYL